MIWLESRRIFNIDSRCKTPWWRVIKKNWRTFQAHLTPLPITDQGICLRFGRRTAVYVRPLRHANSTDWSGLAARTYRWREKSWTQIGWESGDRTAPLTWCHLNYGDVTAQQKINFYAGNPAFTTFLRWETKSIHRTEYVEATPGTT